MNTDEVHMPRFHAQLPMLITFRGMPAVPTRGILFALCIWLCLPGQLIFAQPEDAIVVEDMAEEEPAEEADAAQPPNPNERVFGPEILDQWLFQGGNEQSARKNLESQISMRTADIEQVCELSEAQKKKIQLTGRREAKHLFDQVEELREKFRKSKRTQQNVNEMWQEIQPLRMAFQGGRLGSSKLFDKVIRRTLDAEQYARYQQVTLARQQYRQMARMELILLAIEKQTPLRAEQREKFLAILAELPPVNPGQQEQMAVLYLLSKLPEEKFQAFLDEAQWKKLKIRLDQTQGMAHWLKQNGALPDDDAN